MSRKYLLDRNWAGRAFLVSPSSLSDEINNRRRYHTSSSRKFTDTSMGGNFAINPLPQFSENCDLAHQSIYSESTGTGRWYSEVLEDNSQLIHIRAGVPKFNSMTNFFGNFYNIHAGSVARTGRGPSIWFRVGQVAGVLGTIPLQPFIFAGSVLKFFAGMPRSKYYYLKPTMYPYWYAVSSMVNGIIVNMGMSPRIQSDEQKRFFDNQMANPQADVESMKRVYSGSTWMKEGALDVFAISQRAQRLADVYRKNLDQAMEGLSDDPAVRSEQFARILQDGVDAGIRKLNDPGASLQDYEKAYLAFQGKFNPDENSYAEKDTTEKSWIEQAVEAAKAEARMGAEFVSFRVNNTGTQSESFTNQSTEPTLAGEINSMSSKNRMLRYNTADGNITGIVGGAIQGVRDIIAGTLDSMQLEGLVAVAGNAFADIQKLYQSSSADLNRTTFTIPLRCWSHDDALRVQNLFLPLCAILCLGLPRATGNSSYDGPFLLEVYNQGRTQIREGMVESISIERGVGDVGFARGGKALGIDVNVTIVDMSSILAIAINPGFGNLQGIATGAAELIGGGVGAAGQAVGLDTSAAGGAEAGVDAITALSKNTYAEDNKYTDYLATLASLPLEYQINNTRKWLLNMARGRANYRQWKSAHRVTSGVFDWWPGELIKAISFPTARD